MSYEPTTWNDGDLVTSAKLNKIEQGITANSGVLAVHMIDNGDNSPALDKTWQEIHDADVCYIVMHDDEWSSCSLVEETDSDSRGYMIRTRVGSFIADSPNSTLAAFADDSM